jgi:hypothetical protein
MRNYTFSAHDRKQRSDVRRTAASVLSNTNAYQSLRLYGYHLSVHVLPC